MRDAGGATRLRSTLPSLPSTHSDCVWHARAHAHTPLVWVAVLVQRQGAVAGGDHEHVTVLTGGPGRGASNSRKIDD